MRNLSIKSISLMATAFLVLFFASWPALAQQNQAGLRNKAVQDQQGKELGKVRDVVIAPDGNIEAVIIQKGGFLGLGESQERIPWSELKEGPNSNYLVYAPNQAGATHEVAINLDKFVGKKVTDSQGANLGTVHQVVAGNSGEAYAVIAGSDNRYYPVDLNKLQISGSNDQNVKAEFNKEKMELGPSFTQDQWKTLKAEQWQPRVRAYYGGQPAQEQKPQSQTGAQSAGRPAAPNQGGPAATSQGRPEVTVNQPPPQVTVTQPPPNVSVNQPKPDVTVNPPPPPNVTVRQPNTGGNVQSQPGQEPGYPGAPQQQGPQNQYQQQGNQPSGR